MSKRVTTFINNCITKYTELFTDDWILDLDWSSEENADKSFKTGRAKIEEFNRVCFENIALSFLSGEYIVDRKTFDGVKGSFERYWQQEHLCPEISGEDKAIFKIKSKLYRFYEELDNQIRALFDTYAHFVISIDEKLEYAQHEYLFKIGTPGLRDIWDFRYFMYLRNIFIPLCDIEHNLEFSDSIRTQIAVYKEHLEQLMETESYDSIKVVLQLAIYKATFLLKKLLQTSDSFDILINGDKKTLSRESLSDLPEELNKKFHTYECIHENRKYGDSEIEQYRIRINKGIEKFEDIACLMDYYCKNNGSIQQIDNLIRQFDKKLSMLLHKKYHYNFDNHALCTLRNFLYNCRLSYKISQKSYSIDNLVNDMNEIEVIQSETLVNNFYPYKKALDFLSKEIRRNIEIRNLKFNYQKYIDLFEEYLSKFKQKIDWCEAHKFYPIQMPFKECRVRINGKLLIVPSTITRPINYCKLKDIQLRFQSDLDFFKSSQIYFKDKSETESLKNEVRDIEKRYLEIGGVLIGLVTFLFGTIDIFTKTEGSMTQMFQSILGLGLILVIFAVLLIIVIEYWKGAKNVVKITFCGIILIVYTLLIYSTLSDSKNRLNGNENANLTPDKEIAPFQQQGKSVQELPLVMPTSQTTDSILITDKKK